jgi:predicted nucleic-acid-binding protein
MEITADTNVLARTILQDDAVRRRKAREMPSHTAASSEGELGIREYPEKLAENWAFTG